MCLCVYISELGSVCVWCDSIEIQVPLAWLAFWASSSREMESWPIREMRKLSEPRGDGVVMQSAGSFVTFDPFLCVLWWRRCLRRHRGGWGGRCGYLYQWSRCGSSCPRSHTAGWSGCQPWWQNTEHLPGCSDLTDRRSAFCECPHYWLKTERESLVIKALTTVWLENNWVKWRKI